MSLIPAQNPSIEVSNSLVREFANGEFALTAIMRNGEPWFIAREICQKLEYTNSSQAIRYNVNPEDVYIEKDYKSDIYSYIILYMKKYSTDFNVSSSKPIMLINESGLYDLILKSNQPKAMQFKRWVTKEVLPSIRKTGKYEIEPTSQNGLTSNWQNHMFAMNNALITMNSVMVELKQDQDSLKFEVAQIQQDNTALYEQNAKLEKENQEFRERQERHDAQIRGILTSGTRAGRTPGSRPQIGLDMTKHIINSGAYDDVYRTGEFSLKDIHEDLVIAIRALLPPEYNLLSNEDIVSYAYVSKHMSARVRLIAN